MKQLDEYPTDGKIFAFIKRRRTQLKAPCFDGGGHCVRAKRLKRGRFHPEGYGDNLSLEWSKLRLTLEGIDRRSIRRFKRYSRPEGSEVRNNRRPCRRRLVPISLIPCNTASRKRIMPKMPVLDLCREDGMRATSYKRCAKYGEMNASMMACYWRWKRKTRPEEKVYAKERLKSEVHKE